MFNSSTQGITRINANDIRAALLTRDIEPTEDLVETILQRTKPVDDAIQDLMLAGDVITDDVSARNGDMEEADAQVVTSVLARLIDTTDALLLVRGAMVAADFAGDDNDVPALIAIAHETSAAVRKAAAH